MKVSATNKVVLAKKKNKYDLSKKDELIKINLYNKLS